MNRIAILKIASQSTVPSAAVTGKDAAQKVQAQELSAAEMEMVSGALNRSYWDVWDPTAGAAR